MNQSDWKTRLSTYLLDPQQAWERPDERQVVKLDSVFRLAERKFGLGKEDVVEVVIHAVGLREQSTLSPIYLSNLGGCGSHWISRMLSQASSLVDAGEVYLPSSWYSAFLELPRETSARILDGVELVHGLLYNGEPSRFQDARVINSAHGYEKIAFHRKLRSGATVVHLARDPRDRTMSVAFRKEEFRRYEADGVSDRDYFLSKAMRSLSAWRRYQSLSAKADFEVTYESFRRDAAGQLWTLLDGLGMAPARSLAKSVAYRNSPEYLRSGQATKADVGNLDQGGIAKSWRELPRDLRSMLHTITAPAVVGQGYALCECFANDLDGGLAEGKELGASVDGLDLEGLYVDCRERDATRWRSLADADLASINRLRIRPTGPTIPAGALERLRPWITDVCVAGIKQFDDNALQQMGRLPALLSMDLARTGVATVSGRKAFPSLRRINISGLEISCDGAELEDVTVVRGY